jgi:hypothetical protein
MKNNLVSNFKYCLIAKINGLAVEVKRTRTALLQSKKEITKNNLADRKRFIGNDARHHLLAYALLKGLSYSAVEKKCLPSKKPSAEIIFQIISCHVYGYEIKNNSWTLDKIQRWLKGEV